MQEQDRPDNSDKKAFDVIKEALASPVTPEFPPKVYDRIVSIREGKLSDCASNLSDDIVIQLMQPDSSSGNGSELESGATLCKHAWEKFSNIALDELQHCIHAPQIGTGDNKFRNCHDEVPISSDFQYLSVPDPKNNNEIPLARFIKEVLN